MGQRATLNFRQLRWSYTPSTGFLKLCQLTLKSKFGNRNGRVTELIMLPVFHSLRPPNPQQN